MSNEASAWAFNQGREVAGAKRLVLLVLCDMAGEDNECWPKIKTIADKAGIAKNRTVTDALTWLEAEGYIQRVVNGFQGTRMQIPKGREPNLYRINMGCRDEAGQEEEGCRDEAGGGCPNAAGEGVPQRGTQNPQLDPSSESKGVSDYPEAFEKVWAARPDRATPESKKQASRAWKARVREGADPAHIQAAVEQHARSRIGEDPKYTKQLATYLGPDEHWKLDWEIVQMNEAADSGGPAPKRTRSVDCPQCGGVGWTRAALDRGDGLDPDNDRCTHCINGKVLVDAEAEDAF